MNLRHMQPRHGSAGDTVVGLLNGTRHDRQGEQRTTCTFESLLDGVSVVYGSA
jgi:hypothetical protein